MNFVDALTAATLELTLSRLAFSLSFTLSNIMTFTLYTCCAVLLHRLTLCQYHDDEAHVHIHIQTSICLSVAMKMHSLSLMQHLQYPSI